MSRSVAGLERARMLQARPKFIPLARPRKGSKRYGLSYEKSVAERSGGLHGKWFEFEDANGIGYCQPDVILLLEGEAIVVECKLTEVDEARKQLGRLYIPVVSAALRRPARGIVCVRHLTRESDTQRVVSSMGAALKCASAEYFPTLHWIGKGPL